MDSRNDVVTEGTSVDDASVGEPDAVESLTRLSYLRPELECGLSAFSPADPALDGLTFG